MGRCSENRLRCIGEGRVKESMEIQKCGGRTFLTATASHRCASRSDTTSYHSERHARVELVWREACKHRRLSQGQTTHSLAIGCARMRYTLDGRTCLSRALPSDVACARNLTRTPLHASSRDPRNPKRHSGDSTGALHHRRMGSAQTSRNPSSRGSQALQCTGRRCNVVRPKTPFGRDSCSAFCVARMF